MSPKATPAWHTTDDDKPVPVKIITEEHAPTPAGARVLHAENMTLTAKPSLAMPAVIGIGIALLGFGWYFDLGSILLGDLGGSTEKNVTITAEGNFEPTELDLFPGDTVTVTNENEDPQLLEPDDERELFEVQVIFDEPFTFTVPSDATGEYTYRSGTLPEDRSIIFRVNARPETVEETAVQETEDELPIPIPFGEEELPEVATTHETDPATISLGGQGASASSAPRRTAPSIPVNPYTVGATGADQYRAGELAATQEEQLHSGAPLAQYPDYRPPVTSSTGPEHTGVAVLLLAGLLFTPLARRMLRM